MRIKLPTIFLWRDISDAQGSGGLPAHSLQAALILIHENPARLELVKLGLLSNIERKMDVQVASTCDH
jgi:hypothetical protein